MSGRWNDDRINCDFKRIYCKLDKFERDIEAATRNARRTAGRNYDTSDDGGFNDKRSLEDRLDLLQRELDALDEEITSNRGREPWRSPSPGELSRLKDNAKSYQSQGSQSRRSEGCCKCGCKCCNTFFSGTRTTNPERDSQVHSLRQELRDVNTEKHALQERVFAMEEAQRMRDNETQLLQSQLDSDRVRNAQTEEENDELREEIRRLEAAVASLPVDGGGASREAAAQITQLLQTLNDDMVKAPELCNRLRIAAQQIMDGEKRLTNERSSRCLSRAEVQYLRAENQRLRELAFRANMTAFQVSQTALWSECQLTGRCAVPQCKPVLGDHCTSSSVCLEAITSSECAASLCTCLSGYWANSPTECLPGLSPGAACTDTVQCEAGTPGTTCGASGTCECPAGTYNSQNTECLPTKSPGEACAADVECGDASVHLCSAGTCACQSTHVLVSGTCYPTVAAGGSCTHTQQCTAVNTPSECAGTCICNSGYWDNAGTCSPVKGLGEACSANVECDQTLYVCSGGACACQSGTVAAGGSCHPTAAAGEACSYVEQCTAVNTGATCSGTCACPANTWNNAGTCRAGVAYGGSCSYNEDCTITNARFSCSGGVCSELVCAASAVGGYEYRLAGGPSCSQGRMEVRQSGGAWGMVCDDGYDNLDASVFCRSIGFSSGTGQCCSPHYISGQGPALVFHMDDVACGGSESHIMACPYSGWGVHNCGSGEVYSVTCT